MQPKGPLKVLTFGTYRVGFHWRSKYFKGLNSNIRRELVAGRPQDQIMEGFFGADVGRQQNKFFNK